MDYPLPPSPEVAVERLAGCFDHVTNSYKFYWFLSLLYFATARAEKVIQYQEMIGQIIGLAWSPFLLYQVRFGPRDQLPNWIRRLVRKSGLPADASVEKVRGTVLVDIKHRSPIGIDVLRLGNHAPYRFLRPFVDEVPQGLQDNRVNRAVKSAANALYAARPEAIPYHFPDDDVIELSGPWHSYLSQHYEALSEYALYQLAKHLQPYNPKGSGLMKLLGPLQRAERAPTSPAIQQIDEDALFSLVTPLTSPSNERRVSLAPNKTTVNPRVSQISVDELGLSTRARNVLVRLEVSTIGQLVKIGPSQLRSTRQVGEVIAKEIETALQVYLEEQGSCLGNLQLEQADIEREDAFAVGTDPTQRLLLPLASTTSSIAELGLTRHVQGVLFRSGYARINQLATLRMDELVAIRGITPRAAVEIRDRLLSYLSSHCDIKTPDLTKYSLADSILDHEEPTKPDPDRGQKGIERLKSDLTPLAQLGYSIRTYNALHRSGIITVGQLVRLSDEELYRIRGVGTSTIAEIREKLEEQGDSLLGVTGQASDTEAGSPDHSAQENEIVGQKREVGPVWLGPLLESEEPINILGLSTRSYNALRRAGLKTIGQVAKLSTDELFAIRNLGHRGVAEIQFHLETLVPSRATVTSNEANSGLNPVIDYRSGLSPSLFPGIEALDPSLLDGIAIERLGISNQMQTSLALHSVFSIGDLLRQSQLLLVYPPLREMVEDYLLWLGQRSPNEQATEKMASGISVLYRQRLSLTTLHDVLHGWCSCLTGRAQYVIAARYGLYSAPKTLVTIGSEYQFSRERARQIEKKARQELRMRYEQGSAGLITPFGSLLHQGLLLHRGKMDLTQVEAWLSDDASIRMADVRLEGVLELLADIDDRFRWLHLQSILLSRKHEPQENQVAPSEVSDGGPVQKRSAAERLLDAIFESVERMPRGEPT